MKPGGGFPRQPQRKMTTLECWRLRQDLAAYSTGIARDLREIGTPAAPAAVLSLAKWILWHADKIDAASELWSSSLPQSAARALPTVPRCADVARELIEAAGGLVRPSEAAAALNRERLARLELEVANLRNVLEQRETLTPVGTVYQEGA